ncbi:hypothetical protein WM40_17335 [Robbsia andropogonis]|uniref:Uncharacterized protein n=1 Tax=Robbsia andropogonis TaxID=28092 RepID=A0A0F5JX49_9BURK|nr:hypothetical protein [Robbsia andropogonis]KKB62403.1 hypothetical protein WM40_17335 [Robbsia andropogonis]
MSKTVSKFTCDALIVSPSQSATCAGAKRTSNAKTGDRAASNHPGIAKNTVTDPYPSGKPAPADLNEIHRKFWAR